MVVKWTFLDPTDSSTYQFEINPNDGGTLPYAKSVVSQSTVAPGGKTILFEGAKSVPEMVFSGVILTQAQYNAMITWFNKTHQIQVTDDLGRSNLIYITKFEAQRVRASHTPWKHTYTVTAILVDWP